jgi:pilus assembly protein CpaE
MRKVTILIAGRCREQLDVARDLLADRETCRVELRCISNGHVNPLHGLKQIPDVLLLCDLQCERELETLIELDQETRPALIVFGPGDDPSTIRLAMRAGARDYLTLPEDVESLNRLIDEVAAEVSQKTTEAAGSLYVFVNGKGGSGSSFISSNIAHGLASRERRVLLVDMDLQFGGLCRYLDMTPSRDILDAVHSVEEMDEVSAQAFTNEHDSGLKLLSARTDSLHLNSEIPVDRMVATIKAYQAFNDFVIVDLPRHIDSLGAALLAEADLISVVMQQSFPHLHDTSRLLQIYRKELGIQESRMRVIVNRYVKDSLIQLKDIKKTLQVEDLVRIPNHYRLTSESVNSGVPLAEVSRKGAVVRGLQALYEEIGGVPQESGNSTVTAFQNLFRR